jgi:hypothetical protein
MKIFGRKNNKKIWKSLFLIIGNTDLEDESGPDPPPLLHQLSHGAVAAVVQAVTKFYFKKEIKL